MTDRRTHWTAVLGLLLLSFSLCACQGRAQFGAVCPTLDVHERYAVRAYRLPLGPQDLVADVDGDGSAENQFGVFSQSSTATMFFDLRAQISTGLQQGLGVLLLDLQSSSQQPECGAVAFNLAMPSPPPRFDGSDSFQTLLGQAWLSIPTHRDGDAIVSDPLGVDLSPDATRLDLFLPVSGTPIHFGVYEPTVRLHRTGTGTIEGEIHGALKSTLLDNALSTIAAQQITSAVNMNWQDEAFVQGVRDVFEDQANLVTRNKCKIPEQCCMTSPQTCVILPEEFRVSGFLSMNLAPDVQVFSDNQWKPVPGGTEKNGTSFGIGFTAIAADHQPSCAPGTFCLDPRVQKLISPTTKLLSVSGSAYNDVWVAGEKGTVLHYDGLQWKVAAGVPLSGSLFPLHARAADDVAIADMDSDRLARWNGSAWTLQPKPQNLIARLLIVDPRTILTTTWAIAGGKGAVNQLQDGVWQTIYQAQGRMLNITMIDGEIWASGLNGKLLHQQGEQWREEAIPSGTTAQFSAIWGSGKNNVWAAAPATCVHWNGSEWETKLDCNTPGTHDALWGYRDVEVWIGAEGYVQYLNRRARQPTWRQVALERPISPEGLWGSGATEVWAVGANAALLRYQP